jgi:hypothetical protein
MTPQDRLRISLTAARYLEALEADDQDALDQLWIEAENDPDLVAAFEEVHAGLLEEDATNATATAVISDAVEKHLTSAEIVRPATGPVTVADVARELFQHTPPGLSAESHQMNERLRSASDELPENLGLPALVAWAEAKFGAAPEAYWKAFRQAAIKVRMRANSDVEYQLAARRTKRPEGS